MALEISSSCMECRALYLLQPKRYALYLRFCSTVTRDECQESCRRWAFNCQVARLLPEIVPFAHCRSGRGCRLTSLTSRAVSNALCVASLNTLVPRISGQGLTVSSLVPTPEEEPRVLWAPRCASHPPMPKKDGWRRGPMITAEPHRCPDERGEWLCFH